jgi:hypothetical protein
VTGNDDTRPIGGPAGDDTVITGGGAVDDATSIVSDATVITDPGQSGTPASARLIESPLSDDERKRFFRPPVGDPGSVVPIPERPVTRPIQKISDVDPLADLPPKRKSFDEIIAGEIHRMTDAIPIIGRNRKGEPRRALVAIGLVLAVAVVAGAVVAAVIYFAF